ncbi:uracil permease [Rhodococcus sp. WB1]|jgi:NCS2 family nucleobase:cation symporter-2|uniref:uracil-xanthine permease family protein n=1 Tax=Rhodococcus TaxID=1827 RepID=UPI0002D24604|nr:MULTISPECIES: nucleobase:cation symporter-2 family protein [Rhodococcus]ANZ27700.1 uracil permease [Rhodococcus sp. WB1]KDE11166.1 uracil permease [Rhodococcus aetherivorans]PND50369.1 purine permease [Rhodococcus sp. ENV425]USC15163.1 purine permease [Rhodococcus sp. 11-3]WFS11593.1 nucleobase:cation symporter-2 family protein [Rhodococcus aetherivorans]
MATAHPVDTRLPFGRQLAFGIQHVLIMYTGCITVPLVFGAAVGLDRETVAMLINADLLIAGLITIIQSLGVGKLAGVRLPIVCGATFAGLTPMILIAEEYGLQAVYGSMLVGGIVGLALAWPFAKVIKFFPPLVTGAVLTVVGISLIGVAGGLIVGTDPTAPTFADPANIALAVAVMAVAIGFICLGRGIWTQLGVLIALLVGTVAALPMGLIDLGGVSGSAWLGVPTPFHFGGPEFPITAVVAMSIVMAVVFAESTASMLAVSEITGKPVTKSDIARGLAGDGLSGIFGGIFNAFVDTVFTQNVGAVATTRVYSRYVTATSGVILVVLGALPKVGSVVAALPKPVVGGVGLILFATVAVVGINTLRKVDLSDRINTTIAAVAVGIGLVPELAEGMFDKFPSAAQILLGSGITLAAITAFSLNLLFNHTRLGAAARRSADGTPGTESDQITGESVVPAHA